LRALNINLLKTGINFRYHLLVFMVSAT